MTNDIKNLKGRRVFFLGVNTGFVANRRPDDRFLEFYARRSSPKLHCAIVGNVVVPNGYGSNEVSPIITPDAVWSELADVIRLRGSLPGIQIATTWEHYTGLGPSLIHVRRMCSTTHANYCWRWGRRMSPGY